MEAASGAEICKALKGYFRGAKGMCQCPAHADSSPSLSVSETRDGRVLVHCFAGCDQRAVIDALRRMGLWPDGKLVDDPSYPGRLTTPPDDMDKDERERRKKARELWFGAKDASGTPVETYLRSRAIRLRVPPSIRFAPRCRHPHGDDLPALVGAIQDGEGKITGVQRIYLAADGAGKADVTPTKATLGPMKDGAVRLAKAGEILGLAEGIETALSARQLFSIPVWATLGANRLGAVTLPECVKRIYIFADTGEVGLREAYKAADTYLELGIGCIVQPPEPCFSDWNDVLTGKRREVAA